MSSNNLLVFIQVFSAPGSHPSVGYTTLEELRAQADTSDRWTLQFKSPRYPPGH